MKAVVTFQLLIEVGDEDEADSLASELANQMRVGLMEAAENNDMNIMDMNRCCWLLDTTANVLPDVDDEVVA